MPIECTVDYELLLIKWETPFSTVNQPVEKFSEQFDLSESKLVVIVFKLFFLCVLKITARSMEIGI